MTGIDNIPEAAYLDPPLTTLEQNFPEIGRNSLRALLAKTDGEQFRPVEYSQPQLIVRASTAAPAE